jgi:NTP pyrophosphatase (non-canonical NTP hydrolase)
MSNLSVLTAIAEERVRQESLKREGRFPHTCADAELSDHEKLTILVEEVGEVARAVLNKTKLAYDGFSFAQEKLREELVQVAAVATAWLESIETGGQK